MKQSVFFNEYTKQDSATRMYFGSKVRRGSKELYHGEGIFWDRQAGVVAIGIWEEGVGKDVEVYYRGMGNKKFSDLPSEYLFGSIPECKSSLESSHMGV